jgi:hypothetical protein
LSSVAEYSEVLIQHLNFIEAGVEVVAEEAIGTQLIKSQSSSGPSIQLNFTGGPSTIAPAKCRASDLAIISPDNRRQGFLDRFRKPAEVEIYSVDVIMYLK